MNEEQEKRLERVRKQVKAQNEYFANQDKMKDLIKLANKPPSKKWKTFKKWAKEHMTPIKGEKATFFGGKAYFHKRQVTDRLNPTTNVNYDDPHWDDHDDHYNPYDFY